MPPKVRITREKIIRTAVDIVRRDGPDALNARVIAGELGCSTQPLFSNFATMEELRRAVVSAADALYQQYTDREIASDMFIALGLLCGSVLNDKQVGGICGALLTNLAAWLSGAWFDLDLAGEAFRKIASVLPFIHAVDMERAVLQGNYAGIFPHLWWVLGYAAISMIAAVLLFLRQMKKQ